MGTMKLTDPQPAAALAHLTCYRSKISLAFQALSYPMIEDRTAPLRAPKLFAGEFVWLAADNHFGRSTQFGRQRGSDDASPYGAACPGNLADFGESFIAVSTLDFFVDKDIDYARRLMRADRYGGRSLRGRRFRSGAHRRGRQHPISDAGAKGALQDQPTGAAGAANSNDKG